MDTPHISELYLGVGKEAVVTAVGWDAVVAWATVQHVCVVAVLSDECFTEFFEVQSMVTAAIIAFEEQVHFV